MMTSFISECESILKEKSFVSVNLSLVMVSKHQRFAPRRREQDGLNNIGVEFHDALSREEGKTESLAEQAALIHRANLDLAASIWQI
jgi:hypothetical protein